MVLQQSQKRTSVLQIRRDFSPTRHMTRINVGLVLSLVKPLLSSWKIYICAIWWHSIPTNSGDFYGHKLCSAYIRLIFILLREGFYVKPPEIQTVWRHRQVQRYLSMISIFMIYSQLITLNLLSIFLIYIQENCNWIRQIFRTKRHLSLIWTSEL